MTDVKTTPAKYVIINDCDAPEPRMVCQWVPGIGYCYLERRGTKPSFDGMKGAEATPIAPIAFSHKPGYKGCSDGERR